MITVHTHHTAGEADPPEPRADVVPHPDAAPADALSHGELQEEQRDADEYQQDEIGHQVRSCQSKQRTEQVRGGRGGSRLQARGHLLVCLYVPHAVDRLTRRRQLFKTYLDL